MHIIRAATPSQTLPIGVEISGERYSGEINDTMMDTKTGREPMMPAEAFA